MPNEPPINVKGNVLVFVVGRPSVGKSYFARELVSHTSNLFYVDKDTINNSLLTSCNEQDGQIMDSNPLFAADRSIDEYTRINQKREHDLETLARNLVNGVQVERDSPIYKTVRLPSYALMLALARDNIGEGRSVLLDAPHIKEIKMGDKYFREIASRIIGKDFDIKAILCYAPEQIIYDRMINKKEKRDDYMSQWQSFKKDLEREPIIPPEIEKWNHIKIDTSTKNPEENIKKTLEFLAK